MGFTRFTYRKVPCSCHGEVDDGTYLSWFFLLVLSGDPDDQTVDLTGVDLYFWTNPTRRIDVKPWRPWGWIHEKRTANTKTWPLVERCCDKKVNIQWTQSISASRFLGLMLWNWFCWMFLKGVVIVDGPYRLMIAAKQSWLESLFTNKS